MPRRKGIQASTTPTAEATAAIEQLAYLAPTARLFITALNYKINGKLVGRQIDYIFMYTPEQKPTDSNSNSKRQRKPRARSAEAHVRRHHHSRSNRNSTSQGDDRDSEDSNGGMDRGRGGAGCR